MRLHFSAYNGLAVPLEEGMDREEGRTAAAEYLNGARAAGHDVAILDRGERWEIQTQANILGIAVTDRDGILRISTEPRDELVECDECGDEYDEESGDGYCGLCPGCADAAWETEDGGLDDAA